MRPTKERSDFTAQDTSSRKKTLYNDSRSPTHYPLPAISSLENEMKKIEATISRDALKVQKLTHAFAEARIKESNAERLRPKRLNAVDKTKHSVMKSKKSLWTDNSLFEFSEASTCVTNLSLGTEQNEWLQLVNKTGDTDLNNCTSFDELSQSSYDDISSGKGTEIFK